MRKISILGSTGSIGRGTLEIIRRFSSEYEVLGLTSGVNIDLLEEQIREFHPSQVAVMDEKKSRQLRERLRGEEIKVFSGDEGLKKVAGDPRNDVVVTAIPGSAGLIPTLEAIKSGNRVAIANKEALVMAGSLITREAKKRGKSLIPIDSEHNAIFQCLNRSPLKEIKKIILTASGGPFCKFSPQALASVTPRQALQHPVWKMGKKISIDSATLMNKGLEVIAAHWLFGLEVSQIEVLIHPECIVHSLVEFVDGEYLVLMSLPDMRIPIQYALTYPERKPTGLPVLDLKEVPPLTFSAPDMEKFPCLKYAYEAAAEGGTMPCVLSVANEVAVEAFLEGNINFLDISRVLKAVLKRYTSREIVSLEDVLEASRWAREEAEKVISSRE